MVCEDFRVAKEKNGEAKGVTEKLTECIMPFFLFN